MPINKKESIQVRVTMPREVHEQLKEIAKKRGLSLSALLLTTAIDRGKAEESLRKILPFWSLDWRFWMMDLWLRSGVNWR